jgi:hypothetical protein
MTMTTVGYGDIVPSGNVSRWYAIFVMFSASVFFGGVLTLISRAVSAKLDDQVERRVGLAETLMAHRGLHKELRCRVASLLRRRLHQKRMACMDPELFQLLTPPMQRELSLASLSDVVLAFPLFRNAQRSFVAELAGVTSWVMYLHGDVVVEDGQLICELSFVMEGVLCVYKVNPESSNGQLAYVQLEVGAWFGERCLFDEAAACHATIVAQTDTNLAVLSRDDFFKIMASYPRVQEQHALWVEDLKRGKLQFSDIAPSRGSKQHNF